MTLEKEMVIKKSRFVGSSEAKEEIERYLDIYNVKHVSRTVFSDLLTHIRRKFDATIVREHFLTELMVICKDQAISIDSKVKLFR